MTDRRTAHNRATSDTQDNAPRKAKLTITPSPSDYSRSHVANYTRPAPVTSEEDLLKFANRARTPKEPIIADLVDFEVYRCPETDRKRAWELTSLHLFDVKAKNLCFDGHVQINNNRYYVELVHIEDTSIEGYDSDHNPGVVAYLQTRLATEDVTSDLWLRLGQPALRYARFHSPFLWVAGLGKHVIDYMCDRPRGTVSLEDFAEDFHSWLMHRFGSNPKFQNWLAAFENTDFRVAFNAYVGFFHNQALNLPTSKHLTSHPVWSHCMCDRKMAVARQPNQVKHTLTTPHVYQCFQRMYFAGKLKLVTPSGAVRQMQEKRKATLGFPRVRTIPLLSRRKEDNTHSSHVQVGDVVSIVPDGVDKVHWQKSNDDWLGYVQGTETTTTGAHDVIRKHTVEWSPRSLQTDKEFILRQTYITNDSAFVTIKEDHKICPCRRPKSSAIRWLAGDTVYIKKSTNGHEVLEPVVIHRINKKTSEIQVRKLLRLDRDCSALAVEAKRGKILPNELVLTGKLKTVAPSRVERPCHITFVKQVDVLNGHIASPYNLGGAGDYWFISMGIVDMHNVERLIFLEKLPEGFHEAREAQLPFEKLRGLSLFSGGGGLDRGLEEGGAVEFQTSVDYDSAAIHTQRANCKNSQQMRLFCGSFDDYLGLLLSGDENRMVARVGQVDLVAAGSPCPGFSTLQQNMLSEQSITYASHITTFCTAVDLYRPLFGILENVVNMASTRTGLEDQNVLSQLVACLVSMGYQVNQYIMDSWTYGSIQRRSRIILTIAAPGFEPILQRPHTHSRSYEDTRARSLGKLPNGERFGDREHYATPFPYVSAHDATSDLPDIGNSNTQTCIPYPDHRLLRSTNSKTRALLECIPKCPPGYGYAEAMELSLIPPLLQITKKETGRAYRRIKADGLIPTITTAVHMQDARNGASVHWAQQRPLSIQEARRTQGYPDNEPIIGSLSEQWRTLGNGVDRKVSFSVGLALRDAYTNSNRYHWLGHGPENDAELIVDVEDDHLSEARERPTAALQTASPSSSRSSSTDSFSSTRDARQSLPHRGQNLTANTSRPFKRPREGDEPHQQSVSNNHNNPLKRPKVDTQRSSLPANTTPEVRIKSENRRKTLPPLQGTTHTRRSGLVQFAPRTWHKKIEDPKNIIELA
ncbi:S-adenosyl-L-methionine-dependent methyltransferase [Boeremia exigua]|uniref:S-adenosyl-L-methionine-dependent methyltransferase n=1 Tax=Boeremia exigua TaxID=749465 RepID=UPI001E8D551D|nr:S-adenosyl-L-methionine-dependent methyltransferase [Boeremia exigua]KAH6643908.1 S-adenosyl-L-methionine-dependent methyltransferase [Boeremia exigua]